MILTLKTTLLRGPYDSDRWEGVFEVDAESSLEDIHSLIQDTLSFDDDHLFEFFIAGTETSRERLSFDDENGGLHDNTISSLYPLPKHKRLYYLFDYGDHWLFKIGRAVKTETEPAPNVAYPRLLRESGTRPQQYPSAEEHAF